MILEVGTQNYLDDLLAIKKALSHMQSLLGVYDGYETGAPSSKFGWTCFKLSFKTNFKNAIEEKFSDMLEKYGWGTKAENFAKFMADYLNSKGCNVKISIAN